MSERNADLGATWRPIATAPADLDQDVLLWNGKYVFPGHLENGGWRDARNPEYEDYPELPQPTHWMPFPEPPK